MKDHFYRCDGSRFDIPLFDHIVAEHFNNPATLTDHLVDQMGDDSVYAKMFKGKKDLVFLDIGANIGLISLYAAPACKRIVALEPAPDTFPVLRAMTLSSDNIEAVQIALAPIDGDIEFHLNDINPTASSTVNTYGKLTVVRGSRLNTILFDAHFDHVDVCKIDAEGAEGESLPLFQIQYCKDIIQSYYIEFHNCPKSSWEVKMGNTMKNLQQNGYHKFTVDGMTLYATK